MFRIGYGLSGVVGYGLQVAGRKSEGRRSRPLGGVCLCRVGLAPRHIGSGETCKLVICDLRRSIAFHALF